MRVGLLVVAVALSSCGGEQPQGVEITEADPASRTARTRPSPMSPLDTVYADSGLFVDPSLRSDSLRADSLRRDSIRLATLAQEVAAPDFRAFWPRFQSALEGDFAVGLSMIGLEASSKGAVDDQLTPLFDASFRPAILALTARDFRREGTARSARVIVGFDDEGNVVPQDEALTESSVELRFDVLEGEYRLVGLEAAG